MDTNALVALRKINGAIPLAILGNAIDIDNAATPCLLSDAKIPFVFQTSAQSLEILSGSADDTAAGIGARTILIESLDANLLEVSTIVTLNGTTPVVLPGTHLYVNSVAVASSGSNHTNVGPITLRVAGGGDVQGYIGAGIGIQRAFKFTVPAGKAVIIDNFYGNAGNIGGSNIIVTTEFMIRSQDGTLTNPVTNSFGAQSGPFSVTLPTGFPLTEGFTFYSNLSDVSATGATLALNATGKMYDLSKF